MFGLSCIKGLLTMLRMVIQVDEDEDQWCIFRMIWITFSFTKSTFKLHDKIFFPRQGELYGLCPPNVYFSHVCEKYVCNVYK